MFLNKTIEQNKRLIDFSIENHKNGKIIPDTYVIDLDQLCYNAKMMVKNSRGIKLFFMLKQIGRNPFIAKQLIDVGFEGAVVVDYKEALIMIENNIKIGNIGHLVQIPRGLLKKILLAKPEFITVFSFQLMDEINKICEEENIVQKIMLKVVDLKNDNIYEGQYGGLEVNDLDVKKLKSYLNLDICGLTAFPCILLNESDVFEATNNTKTILKTKEILLNSGFNIQVLNMPSANACYSFELLKKLGATHAEPGHGLTGSTPYHLKINDQEQISMVYVTEVSHTLNKISYCYGGGYYRRGNLKKALIGKKIVEVFSPSNESIDYYFGLDGEFDYGETVIMNFRTQIFVTRSNVMLVSGLKNNDPVIRGIYDSQGKRI